MIFINILLAELGLRNCHNVGEYGYRHLALLKNLQYLDLYRTMVELGSLKLILKASPQLQHINLGEHKVLHVNT